MAAALKHSEGLLAAVLERGRPWEEREAARTCCLCTLCLWPGEPPERPPGLHHGAARPDAGELLSVAPGTCVKGCL